METEILQHKIKYNYFNGDNIPEEMTTLDDAHIYDMIIEGYSSGDLNGENYRGWWEILKA